MEISVVIPCLNEEENVKKCIDKCFNSFKTLNVEGEVIVVDNNCTDNTVPIAKECGARVVECKDPGYGFALRKGFENATGKYIVMGDADDSYDFNDIPRFYEKITINISGNIADFCFFYICVFRKCRDEGFDKEHGACFCV